MTTTKSCSALLTLLPYPAVFPSSTGCECPQRTATRLALGLAALATCKLPSISVEPGGEVAGYLETRVGYCHVPKYLPADVRWRAAEGETSLQQCCVIARYMFS